jgi:hypothetical protein
VQTGPDLKAEGVDAIADGTRASDRARRTVEGGEQAVTGSVDLAATKSG